LTQALRFFLNQADVIFERFDEEIVAIQLSSGNYHSISGAGIDAFLLLASEPTIEELVDALARKYDASAATIAQDMKAFLDLMRAESLIGVRETQSVAFQPLELMPPRHAVPYAPPSLQPFRDLQDLFLIDPVHDVGPQGWPQTRPGTSPDQAECRYRPRDPANMIFERFDDETVVLNQTTGACYNLTGAAEDIFLLLREDPTRAEIVHALGGKYQAPEATIAEAVSNFLGELVEQGAAEAVAEVAGGAQPLPIRRLTLAKPGQNVPFVKPKLEGYQERAVLASLAGSRVPTSLEFARKRFRIAQDSVAFRAAGRELVAINFNKGEYFLLNPSASVAIRLLEQAPTATELVDHLSSVYTVNRRELTVAALILLRTLTQEGLVVFEDAGNDARSSGSGESIAPQPFEPFSVEAFRELRSLFLPFPGVRNEKPAGNARELVSLLSDYHREAGARAGLTEGVYRIAGLEVKVRCAGALRVSELGLAFGHLKNGFHPGSDVDLTIHVWDAVSGGGPKNPFLSNYLKEFYSHWDTLCGPRGEVLAYHTEELPVLYHGGPDIFSIIDVQNRAAYYLKRDASPLPYWEVGSPFRTILHYWLSRQGLQFVHGGAVGSSKGGAILVGKGGSGKSTVSLACLNAGMSYAGDDYCAVQTEGPPYLHSLYSTAKLKGPQDLDRFPHLRGRVWNRDWFTKNGDKATFFLTEWWPEQMSQGFPLRAVLVPHVTGQRDTELGECSEAQALLALSASTVAQLPMAGAPDLDRLGNLVSGLPRYMLYAGTDLAQIPRVISSIL
jgi:hypothetical protein